MASSNRTDTIIDVLRDAFAPLMRADPAAFRAKYRKMARDPHAFYRGSACLFFNDVTQDNEVWAGHGAERIWIHGDLHVENFGTYLNSDGRLVFDINDFDEAYVGHFTWDLQRFAASLALVGWREGAPRGREWRRPSGATRAHFHLRQVNHYVASDTDDDFEITLDAAARRTGADRAGPGAADASGQLLDGMTHMQNGRRRFTEDGTTRRLKKKRRRTIRRLPRLPRHDPQIRPLRPRALLRAARRRREVGIRHRERRSAGLQRAGQGYGQALDNDVVLSMKQANHPGPEPLRRHHRGRCLLRARGAAPPSSASGEPRVHADPLLGHTSIDGVGYVVAEVSPYEVDLDWSEINEPEDMRSVVDLLGRATAKIHCASDEDGRQDLVDFDVEAAIAQYIEGRRNEFVQWLCDWGIAYAVRVREDHALVDAFREGQVGIAAT